MTLGSELDLARWAEERWGAEEAARLSGCPVASLAAVSGPRAVVLEWLERTAGEILASRAVRLLLRNWRRFAEKFGLGDASYGDLSGMKAAVERAWTREKLQT